MHTVCNYVRSLKNVDQMRIRKPDTNIMYVCVCVYMNMKIPHVLLLHH